MGCVCVCVGCGCWCCTCVREIAPEVVDAHPGERSLLLAAQDATIERVVEERVPVPVQQDVVNVIHDGVRLGLQ